MVSIVLNLVVKFIILIVLSSGEYHNEADWLVVWALLVFLDKALNQYLQFSTQYIPVE